jgi:predicted nucleic acid-binding protein
MIDLADLLVGSTALTHNIPVATLNKKHFERIKKLTLIE